MKKLLFCLIAILTSFTLQAQDSLKVSREICLADSIVSNVIDELLIKDHLVFTVNKQDSIIRIYHHQDSLYEEEIFKFKVKAVSYEETITKLNSVVKIRTDEVKDLQQHEKKIKAKATAIQIVLGVAIILILVL